ncbi:MAG: hypothetical protein AAGC65_12210 [Mucilaginibacter sp.]|uniref:hypothetical protein n=1 Tax=Mucilaginibacter sp. TaxID=1882438 RepID=UPI0031A4EE61
MKRSKLFNFGAFTALSLLATIPTQASVVAIVPPALPINNNVWLLVIAAGLIGYKVISGKKNQATQNQKDSI